MHARPPAMGQPIARSEEPHRRKGTRAGVAECPPTRTPGNAARRCPRRKEARTCDSAPRRNMAAQRNHAVASLCNARSRQLKNGRENGRQQSTMPARFSPLHAAASHASRRRVAFANAQIHGDVLTRGADREEQCRPRTRNSVCKEATARARGADRLRTPAEAGRASAAQEEERATHAAARTQEVNAARRRGAARRLGQREQTRGVHRRICTRSGAGLF